MGLVLAACGKLASYVAHGCRLSPYSKFDEGEEISTEEEDEAIADELSSLNLRASSSSEGNLHNVSSNTSFH